MKKYLVLSVIIITCAQHVQGVDKENVDKEKKELIEFVQKHKNCNINWRYELGLKICDLSGAHLEGADLREASLRGAYLRYANLEGADLSKANLFMADLRGAKLIGANLSGAILQEAKLSGAKLSGADLSGANLWEAKLQRAKLQGADLSNANLQRAKLQGADLKNAIFDKETRGDIDLLKRLGAHELPSGSYINSCDKCHLNKDNDTLTCDCKDSSEKLNNTTLKDFSVCQAGSIINNNGKLECARPEDRKKKKPSFGGTFSCVNKWKVFGIEPSSTKREIKQRYRKLVLTHHPDKVSENTAENLNKMIEINAAYECFKKEGIF